MTEPLVSIITPSFNQAAYLEFTLQSVLRQDYPHLEYLVVDGGSTDGSREIIQKYADRLAWWVSEPDRGQADAINKGLQRARGEVVAWLNSDDLYLPGAVRAAVTALQADPGAALAHANAFSIDAAGKIFNLQTFRQYTLVDLAAFNIICQPAVFMRRAALENAGYLDLSYHFLLDHQLWLRVGQQGGLRHVDQFWAAARYHAGAKNVAQAGRFGQEALRILDWLAAQPDIAAAAAPRWDEVQAGAQRLNARYLLDGGLPRPALQAYWAALRLSPKALRPEAHRMLFAALSLVGLGGLGALYYRWRDRRRLRLPDDPRLAGWSGLQIP